MIREPRPSWITLLRAKGWVAIAVVTAITVVLIGGVVTVTTNLGCGPANQMGMKLARCTANGKAAAYHSPIPLFIPSPSAKGGPFATPATAYPPQNNPATYYPPQNNPATYYPPNAPPGSSGQQPTVPFVSGFPPSSAPLNCTLPVYVGPPGSGGFVSFPAGNFTADPRSAVAAPSPGPQQGPGYGYSGTGLSYDRTHSRWLPAVQQLVSPDGGHYAYASSSGIYVVDASNGSQVEIGEGRSWSLLRVLNDRVYATVTNAAGFWSVPFSGTPVEVTTTGFWQAATSTYAFGFPTSAVPQGATPQLLRLEVATGKTIDWFSVVGAGLNVFGFDSSGDPIVQSSYVNGWELWLVTGANSASEIANSQEGFFIQGPMVSDSHGVWIPIYYQFGSTQALALFVPGMGLYLVSNVGAQIGGPCV